MVMDPERESVEPAQALKVQETDFEERSENWIARTRSKPAAFSILAQNETNEEKDDVRKSTTIGVIILGCQLTSCLIRRTSLGCSKILPFLFHLEREQRFISIDRYIDFNFNFLLSKWMNTLAENSLLVGNSFIPFLVVF